MAPGKQQIESVGAERGKERKEGGKEQIPVRPLFEITAH